MPGWRTNQKIIVIHSDDWGTIRMPSTAVREQLDAHPAIDAQDAYAYYDTLASSADLEHLFEVLTSVKGGDGRPAILTANCLVANPDFERIRASNFGQYFYESLTQTFERYGQRNALKMWKKGLNAGVFVPQFHGREHVNVPLWLKLLREGHSGVKTGFEAGVFGVRFKGLPQGQRNLQRAWDLLVDNTEQQISDSIVEGLYLFRQQFGNSSLTAIAPNYTWSEGQEQLLAQHGVIATQGILNQRQPTGSNIPYRYVKRFTRGRGKNTNMAFQRRNVFFEPSLKPHFDFVDQALTRISIAFKMGKPAVVGSHRVNYVGSLSAKNRDNNLVEFKKLLQSIIKKWPDVIFMSAAQLAELQ